MRLIAPAIAAEPCSAEMGPRIISTRSKSSALRVVKSKEPPRALVSSLSGIPSSMIRVWFGSSPRPYTDVRPPRAPGCRICRPARCRSTSAIDDGCIAVISASVMTSMLAGRSARGRGALDPVTTIVSTGELSSSATAVAEHRAASPLSASFNVSRRLLGRFMPVWGEDYGARERRSRRNTGLGRRTLGPLRHRPSAS